MFVRWKNRTLARKNESGPAERSLYAVIVKNQRIEGRTKQKVVKYLAHISESHLMDPLHQAHFWARVDVALAELAQNPDLSLGRELRAEIEEKLAAVVPKPSPAEIARLAHQSSHDSPPDISHLQHAASTVVVE